MIGSTVILRAGCLAAGKHLLDQAVRLPKDLISTGLDRASTWARWASTITVSNAREIMDGIQIASVDFEAEEKSLTETISTAGVHPHVVNNTYLVRIDSELIGVPESFETCVKTSKHVHFAVGSCMGGCSSAANRMLEISSTKFTSAHVERYAASAAALLVTLTPGRRSMGRNATLLVHASRNVVFGTAQELRRRAEALEKSEDETAARLAKRTGQSVRWCRSLLDGRDYTFTAAEAKRRGLVDEVVA